MECMDCNKKEATNIIYDRKKNNWFLICDRCVKEEDLTVPSSLIKKLTED